MREGSVERGALPCSRYDTEVSSLHGSGTYPANGRLDHLRNVILMQAKQVGGLAVHSEAVGVVVVLHRADKASVPRHHIGQLRMKERETGKGDRFCHPAWAADTWFGCVLTAPTRSNCKHTLNQRLRVHLTCILPELGWGAEGSSQPTELAHTPAQTPRS